MFHLGYQGSETLGIWILYHSYDVEGKQSNKKIALYGVNQRASTISFGKGESEGAFGSSSFSDIPTIVR